MKLEVALQEQVDEVTGVYYKLFKEVVDTNVTAFQDFFQKLRVLEQAWGTSSSCCMSNRSPSLPH